LTDAQIDAIDNYYDEWISNLQGVKQWININEVNYGLILNELGILKNMCQLFYQQSNCFIMIGKLYKDNEYIKDIQIIIKEKTIQDLPKLSQLNGNFEKYIIRINSNIRQYKKNAETYGILLKNINKTKYYIYHYITINEIDYLIAV
jgi:hypothetical protein